MRILLSSINDRSNPPLAVDSAEARYLFNKMGAEVESVDLISDESGQVLDVALDLEITPNRPDLLGVIGLVREICAGAGTSARAVLAEVDEDDIPVSPDFSVESEVLPGDSHSYYARKISNVSVGRSPEWLIEYLRRLGVAPVNNIVDVATYVMLETGHPIHIYDADKIADTVKLRYSVEGEVFAPLNGEAVTLSGGDIVVVDSSNNILSVAGVIGGQSSMVGPDTKNILIESAHFDHVSIRGTSKKLGVQTDASYRFERGVDKSMPKYALARATGLVREIIDGAKIEDSFGFESSEVETRRITLKYKKLSTYIGEPLAPEYIQSALESLGFSVLAATDEEISVLVPTWRMNDVKRDVCLIEEVAKVYGLGNIKSEMPTAQLSVNNRSRLELAKNYAYEFFRRAGFHEVVNFGFYSPGDLDDLSVPQNSALRDFVRINQPVSSNYSVLRSTLIPSLLQNLLYNINRGTGDVKIFELARTFRRVGDERTEKRALAGLVHGKYRPANWREQALDATFDDIKAIIYSLLSSLNIDLDSIELRMTDSDLVFKNEGADIYIAGEYIGFMGYLTESKSLGKEAANTLVFELDFDQLVDHSAGQAEAVVSPSRYPSVKRDITIECSTSLESAKIEEVMRRHGGELLTKLDLSNIYSAPEVPGFVSLTFSVEFCSQERALTREEVNTIVDKILLKLENDFQVKIKR